MRVLIVHYYVGRGGGAETAVRNQAKALSANGVQSEVTNRNPFVFMPNRIKEFDLIHFHTIHIEMGLAPLVEARKNKVPHCVSLHDYWPFCQGRMLLKNFDEGCAAVEGRCDGKCRFSPTSELTRSQLKGTPTIIFNNKSAEIMRRNGVEISAIIPHGIDTEFFSCPESKERDWGKIITVAAWASHPSKGMHILRKALSMSGLGATLVTGKTHEVVRDSLCNSGIFIFPSVYEETFGLSLVEAMSCGCACISTDVAGPLDIIENNINGVIVKKRDVEALAGAMSMLSQDPLLCWQLGSAAKKKANEEYSLSKYGARLKEFYETIV